MQQYRDTKALITHMSLDSLSERFIIYLNPRLLESFLSRENGVDAIVSRLKMKDEGWKIKEER